MWQARAGETGDEKCQYFSQSWKAPRGFSTWDKANSFMDKLEPFSEDHPGIVVQNIPWMS